VWGWILAIAVSVAYAAVQLLRLRKQIARDLQHPPFVLVLARVIGLTVILLVFTYILNANRARVPGITVAGIPYVVPIVGVLLVFWTLVLGRTSYGRHLYAVGGNAEAARRAGIDVPRIRITVFMICSSMAALSGIIAASRLNSVTPDAGGTVCYRVISTTPPEQGAEPAEPAVDDGYVALMHQLG